MSLRRRCVRMIDSFVSLVLVLAIVLLGSYSAFALWDNKQVYSAAKDVQIKMQELKPDIEAEEGPSLSQLVSIHPDVKGWLTLDGTAIDYPVLQGESNLSYINTDVYGNFALAGSIFMDCRNNGDFSDSYNLIYGHHMANSNMFGDLDLYREEPFFRENRTGILMTEGKVYDLQLFAVLVISASEDQIFEVRAEKDLKSLFSFIEKEALYHRELPELNEGTKILALTTCSSDFSDARTIVIAEMKKHFNPSQEDSEE